MSFRIFKRKTWKKQNGRYVPHAGRGTTVCHVETYEEARRICTEANKNRPLYGTAGYHTFVYHEFTEA